MTQTYKITFSGIILFGYDEDQTKADIQKLLKLNPAQMEHFFSGNLVVIKKNLPLDDAQRIVSALESKGLMINLVEEGRVIAEKKVELSLARAATPPLPPIVETQAIESPVRHANFSERASRSTSSYYEAPKSSLTSKREAKWVSSNGEDAPDFFKFSFEGRYGRLNYLNMLWAISGVMMLMMLVGVVLLMVLGSGGIYLVAVIIGIFYAFFTVRATVLRLHDVNRSGWLACLLLAGVIPILGAIVELIFVLYLMFARGTDGHNDFGSQPKKGSIAGLILMCIAPVFLGILAGFSMPAYRDYTTRTYVAEGLELAKGHQFAVTEYYKTTRSWPNSNGALGASSGQHIMGQAVERIDVTYGGKIIIQYNQKVDRGTLILEPTINGGQVDWNCYGGTVKSKNRPARCRR